MIASERRTETLPALCVRAWVAPSSVNETDRTIDLVFSTGAPVERYDYLSGKRYIETLSINAAHIRLGRLNAGAPLLDTHSAYSVRDQIGTVVPGTAMVVGKQARATVRFSKRDDVEPIWRDVRDGITRNVSVGYRVHTYEETPARGNALPTRLATDWEPFELSLVPMPADVGAQTRSARPVDTNPCAIIMVSTADADRLRRLRLAKAWCG